MPHCVVFVFDGSSEPFLDPESLEFFQTVFEDCSKMGEFMFCNYRPVLIKACLT